MAVRIDIGMPRVCWECPCIEEEKNSYMYLGAIVGSKCRLLPIKDMEGNIIAHQTVVFRDEIESQKRYKYCPLKEIQE